MIVSVWFFHYNKTIYKNQHLFYFDEMDGCKK